MLCKSLTEGMMLKIGDPDKIGWFHPSSFMHAKNLKSFSDLPPKFVIGPDAILSLVKLDGIDTIVRPKDIFMYIGKKRLISKKGESKTFRLIFAKNKVGYIDSKDIRHLEPANLDSFEILETDVF